jgi:hypothetical protein
VYIYSDKSRENLQYSLPDVEVFYVEAGDEVCDEEGNEVEPGWYWWSCQIGCLPDSLPHGPFRSEEGAVADAQDDI